MDSDDSISLADLKSHNAASLEGLRHKTIPVQCEFCDRKFKTRFASIKHNASHIIIPIIKLTLFQCDRCHAPFTSLEELQNHIIKNHEKIQLADPKETHTTKKSVDRYEVLLKSIVEKEVVVKCHDIFSEVLKESKIMHRKPSIADLSDTISKFIQSGTEKKPDSELIPTFEISSESDSDTPIRKPINTERVRKVSKKGKNNLERVLSNPKSLENNQERVHNAVRRQSNPNKVRNNPERVQNNTERVENNPKRVQNNPDKDSSTPDRDSGTPDIPKERSSSLDFTSLKDLSSSQKKDSSPNYEPITSRIIFEDEDDDLFQAEEILPDLDLKYPKSILGNAHNGPTANSFILGSQVACDRRINGNTDSEINGVEKYTSVHYDELAAGDLCDCRYCGRVFFNRFQLIKHQIIHIRFRRARPALCAICERYIAGVRALRNHMQTKHPGANTKLPLHKCFTCHLRYHNYYRHTRLYHLVECSTCHRRYDKDQLQNHQCFETDSFDMCKVIKMCEMCVTFAKNKQNLHYEVIGEFSEVGARQQCEKCQCLCFDVNLVKRKITYREGTDLSKKRKPLSNKERLKKMQKRLRMVNKMNKC